MSQEKQRFRSKRALLTGFVALFPLVLTLMALRIVWEFVLQPISEPLGNLIISIIVRLTPIPEDQIPAWYNATGTIAALALAFVSVYVIGLILATFLGRRLLRMWDNLLTRIPVMSTIYPHAKQISNFLFGKQNVRFNRVVAIEYPRKDVYSIGFATSSGPQDVARQTGMEMVSVFVPTSPAPFTGWTVTVPASEVIDVDMTVDQAIRFTVSCGVIVPGEAQVAELSPLDEAPPEQNHET